jgi:hypothetical protein
MNSKIYLLCGLPGSGKTFWAKNFVKSQGENAECISHDEEFFKKYGKEDIGKKHDEYSEILKTKLLEKIKESILAGKDVILDYGFWKKSDREEYKNKFNDVADVKIIHFDVPKEIRYDRVLARDKTNNYDLNLEALEIFERKFEIPNGEGEIIFTS